MFDPDAHGLHDDESQPFPLKKRVGFSTVIWNDVPKEQRRVNPGSGFCSIVLLSAVILFAARLNSQAVWGSPVRVNKP